MAAKTDIGKVAFFKKTVKVKKTSIGMSAWSRPLNKSKRRNWKRYRGQGRP